YTEVVVGTDATALSNNVLNCNVLVTNIFDTTGIRLIVISSKLIFIGSTGSSPIKEDGKG
ncbi:hypothetical protein CRM22_011222, partial [Opisthorchis felineus]